MTTARRILAEFVPQAWINGRAVAVDPPGPTRFDVTDLILAMDRQVVLNLCDDDYLTDALLTAPTALPWMRDWPGPYFIRVEKTIANYFAST